MTFWYPGDGGEAERKRRVRRLVKAGSRRPGRGNGMDPDAVRAAHRMHAGTDGERAPETVSVEEQRARYAARREAEQKLIDQQRRYYSRHPGDDQ